MANIYGGYVWEDVETYEAGPGDSWDDIATLAYGNPRLCSLLIYANRPLCEVVVFEGGEIVDIPVIIEGQSQLTPPWRR